MCVRVSLHISINTVMWWPKWVVMLTASLRCGVYIRGWLYLSLPVKWRVWQCESVSLRLSVCDDNELHASTLKCVYRCVGVFIFPVGYVRTYALVLYEHVRISLHAWYRAFVRVPLRCLRGADVHRCVFTACMSLQVSSRELSCLPARASPRVYVSVSMYSCVRVRVSQWFSAYAALLARAYVCVCFLPICVCGCNGVFVLACTLVRWYLACARCQCACMHKQSCKVWRMVASATIQSERLGTTTSALLPANSLHWDGTPNMLSRHWGRSMLQKASRHGAKLRSSIQHCNTRWSEPCRTSQGAHYATCSHIDLNTGTRKHA